MKQVTTIGIDLAKSIFQVHGADVKGKKIFSKKLTRKKLADFIVKHPRCTIGMEACGSSHYWGRRFKEMGHKVNLMSAQYVKPYVKTNKNDSNDAEAICEAVTRPTMRYVGIKTVEQQDMQAVHRVRSRLVKTQTQLTNQIRGLLAEYGIIIPRGMAGLRNRLPDILEDTTNELTSISREIFFELYEEVKEIAEKIELWTARILQIGKRDERVIRLQSIPGIGPISAAALVASVGNAREFKKGRQLSAYLGLVPRQNSSGGKEKLLGISKRGDRYIRCLMVHGARAVVRVAQKKRDPYSEWIKKLIKRRGQNKATVAVANKNVRMAWSILANGGIYKQELALGLTE